MDFIIGQTIDYELCGRGSERPAAHTQCKLIWVAPPPPRKLAHFSSIQRVKSGVVRSGSGETDERTCQSAEYGRTWQDLVRAEPILAMYTAERLSIRRMGVLGTFPAVLDDLNFKLSRGSMPPWTSLVCSSFNVQFTQKKGYKQEYRHIASPFIQI